MNRPTRTGRFPALLEQAQGAPVRVARGELLRPQRHLEHSARDASRRTTPSGLGLDSATVRARMVERLRASGIDCEPVLSAFLQVERHRFVDSALANQAYEDTSLPIGLQQTISKPSVVARMLTLLFGGDYAREKGRLGKVLEIGTGCGYQAALLSLVADSVVSVERIKPLHDKARQQLEAWPHGHLLLLHGDGRLGHAPGAPYQAIVAAAGGEDLPASWLEQLAPGGRLVAPTHDAARGSQGLLVIDRHVDGSSSRRWHDAVHFVPLKSGIE